MTDAQPRLDQQCANRADSQRGVGDKPPGDVEVSPPEASARMETAVRYALASTSLEEWEAARPGLVSALDVMKHHGGTRTWARLAAAAATLGAAWGEFTLALDAYREAKR